MKKNLKNNITMDKSIKSAIPKSHYEITQEFLEKIIGSFNEYVEIFEPEVGPEPSFINFSRHITTERNLPFSAQQNMLHANVMFHQYNMWQANAPIYYITPQLAIELAKTELNVDTEFLMSPFREIHVQIEPGLFSIHDDKGTYPVTGFYVFFDRHDTDIIEIRIMAVAIIDIKEEIVDDTNFYFKLLLPKGKLKPILKEYLDKVVSPLNTDELIKFGGVKNIGHAEEFTYFVMNVLLYLTSKDPDIVKQLPVNFDEQITRLKSASKINKLKKKKSRYTKCIINIVGPNFKLNNDEYNDIKNAGGIGGWKLKHKVKVSAHWRTQWYGSIKGGNRKSENIRIDSYVKGPDAAELLSKKRVVT